MSNKREGEFLYSEDESKKFKYAQNTILIFDIPEDKSVWELKASSENNCFIPTSKGHHLKIMYYFSNPDESGVNPNVKALVGDCILEFNSRQMRSRDEVILEIQSIIDEFRPLVDQKFKNRLKDFPPGERVIDINPSQRLDKSIQVLLDNTKQQCLNILIQHHEKIIEAFRCLEKEIAPGESRDISTDDCTWLALYCIVWFFAFKISKNNLIRYRSLIHIFQRQKFVSFFSCFQECDKILMHLVVDIFWQLIILENQFKEEEEIIDSLPNLVTDSSDSLQEYSPEIYKLIPELFKSALVKSKIGEGIISEQIIQEFISKIYLVSFPASLQGLTLLNSYIAIKRKSNSPEQLKTEPVYKGFTLMTILHEFGHFLQRFNLNTSMKWLDHQSPEYMIDPVTHIPVREAGSELITGLFGHDPEWINIPASDYIMEIKNWNNLEEFNKEFDQLNAIIGGKKTRGVHYTARLNQLESTDISLIGCSKGNRQ